LAKSWCKDTKKNWKREGLLTKSPNFSTILQFLIVYLQFSAIRVALHWNIMLLIIILINPKKFFGFYLDFSKIVRIFAVSNLNTHTPLCRSNFISKIALTRTTNV